MSETTDKGYIVVMNSLQTAQERIRELEEINADLFTQMEAEVKRADEAESISRLLDALAIKRAQRIQELQDAIKAALAHISSHQVYDKDTRGVLERALAGVDLMGNPTAK